jgi:putative glutamine amidotransferase
MEQTVHPVTLAPGSRLAAILRGVNFEVNSAHHQAVKQPGMGLTVTAHAPDGVIEALELPDHPFCVGVQWHPEAMVKVSDTMWPLFAAFVAAATSAQQ